jgi:hypothetical protein
MRPGELGGLEWEKWALKGGGSEAVSARLARGLARASVRSVQRVRAGALVWFVSRFALSVLHAS